MTFSLDYYYGLYFHKDERVDRSVLLQLIANGHLSTPNKLIGPSHLGKELILTEKGEALKKEIQTSSSATYFVLNDFMDYGNFLLYLGGHLLFENEGSPIVLVSGLHYDLTGKTVIPSAMVKLTQTESGQLKTLLDTMKKDIRLLEDLLL